jgi:hypothetical protein
MIEKFKQIKVVGLKSGTCGTCGKKCSRSISLTQTLNPFNKKNGRLKTEPEIRAELANELGEWRKEQIYHAKCEPDDDDV